MSFKALSKNSCGPKVKGTNLIILNELNDYFQNHFIKIIYNDVNLDDVTDKQIDNYKLDCKNLSYIINSRCTEMETSYRNNIIFNFIKYIFQYVNETFLISFVYKTKSEKKKLNKKELQKYMDQKKENESQNKFLKKELILVKNDLLENTLTSPKKYHKWITENKKNILPERDGKMSIQDDINLNPYKYTKYMLIINNKLQIDKKKQFQAIPLRTQINDKYAQIDTKTIEDIFTEVNTDIEANELWKKYFNLNKFKIKNFSFNNLISTDGHSVSINFINDLQIEGKIKKHKAMSEGSKKSKDVFKNKTQDEIDKIKKEKKEREKNKKKEYQKRRNEQIKKLKEDFKLKSLEEQEKTKLEIKLKNNKFEYIEDAVKDDDLLKELKKALEEGRIVVIDPGCRSPMTMLGFKNHMNEEKIKKIQNEIKNIYDEYAKRCDQFDVDIDKSIEMNLKSELDQGIINVNKDYLLKCQKKEDKILYNYSNKRRMKETKRLKTLKLIDNKKKKTFIDNKTIKEMEAKISNFGSKTIDLKEFEKYAKIKIEMRLNINKEYNEYVKKLKMNTYINLRRHEDKLLDELENIFGKNAIMIIGNWSKQTGLKYISTPNMRMKKLLSKRFKVFLIDEYKTSRIYHKIIGEEIYESKDENKIKFTFKTKDNKEIKKTIHSILTFKMSNKRSECINRDYNATLNMLAIVKYLIEHRERPKCFTYEKPLQPVKGSNVKKLENVIR